MDELKSLIQSLNRHEVRQIRKYYNPESHNKNTKSLILFDAIRNKKVNTKEEAAQLIYDAPPNSHFTKLKKRVKQDITRFLLIQDAEQAYKAPGSRAQFNCLRKYIVGKLLIARGVYQYGTTLLEEAEQIAIDYELSQEQILIKDLLRSHLGPKKGIETYQHYENEIWDSFEMSKEILQAREYYHHLIPTSNKANQDPNYQDFTYKATKELAESFQKTNSIRVGYWYYCINIYYYYVNKNFEKSLDFSLKLIRLLEEHDLIRTNARYANANMQSAANALHLYKPAEAIKYAKQAKEYFQSGMMNELTALMVLFSARFHNNQLKEAKQLLQEAYAHPKIEESPYLLPKWRYFEANIAYREGNYEDSMTLLSENSVLMKDKSGWLLGFKYMEILNLIEQEEYDLLLYKLDTLAKLIQQHKDEPLARFKVIFTLLKRLSKFNFDYEKVWEKESKNIKRLEQSAGNYHWNPLEYELIRFDTWLKERVSKENPSLVKADG